VLGAEAATVVIGNVLQEYSVPAGIRFVGTRTSTLIPFRTNVEVPTVSNLVRGDMLESTALDRQLRVAYVNPNATAVCSISGDGTTATLVLGSGDTTPYNLGMRIYLLQAGDYTGEQVITGIVDTTTLEFSSTSTASESGYIVGNTVEIDENLAWSDDINSRTTYTVASRWLPVEAPLDSWETTPKTTIYQFDSAAYDNQAYLRSVEVADTLFLTNGADEVSKFDGENLYLAGLPRWQPHLFVAVNTAAAGKPRRRAWRASPPRETTTCFG
jgi:hypothetical protein